MFSPTSAKVKASHKVGHEDTRPLSTEGAYPRQSPAAQTLKSQFEHLWEKIKPELLEYLESMDDPESPVVQYNSPSELMQKLDLNVPSEGAGMKTSYTEQDASEEIREIVKTVMQTSVRTASARFFDKLYVGADAVGMISELLTASMNTNMHTFAVCPAFAVIELHLLKELRRLIGMPSSDIHDGDGIFCPGGSYANMLAMLCARDKFLPGSGKKGLISYSGPELVSFTSAQSHYSIQRASAALGLGSENVVKVSCDQDGRMIPSELERLLKETIANGKLPFFVNATAGTTVTGAFDAIDKIADVLSEFSGMVMNQFGSNSIWLHVDGSWGAAVMMSDKYRHYLNGSSRADSFTFNPHKMLGVPLQCSALLVRESDRLARTCASNAEYLFHPSDDAAFDLGDKTLQCGRKVDSLKFFLSWKYYGTSGFGARVDHAFDLSQFASRYIRQSQDMLLAVDVHGANVCFWYLPTHDDIRSKVLEAVKPKGTHSADTRNIPAKYADSLDKCVRDTYKSLQQRGKALLNHNPISDQNIPRCFRLVLNHPSTTESLLVEVFNEIRNAAKEAGWA